LIGHCSPPVWLLGYQAGKLTSVNAHMRGFVNVLKQRNCLAGIKKLLDKKMLDKHHAPLIPNNIYIEKILTII
jgi:hypothetical protein